MPMRKQSLRDPTLRHASRDAPLRWRRLLAHVCGQMVLLAATVNVLLAMAPDPVRAAEPASRLEIVALGDSLTAGFGVAPNESFPAVLEAALRAAGHDVVIQNAGVSGDTTAGGLARLDWAVPESTSAVILELGANDMLGGLSPERARANLEAIIVALRGRGIEVLLTGMRASRTLGEAYTDAFDRIFPELAAKHDLLLYPFFLDGVALDPKLNQPDGIHPTGAGVREIVKRIQPAVEALIARTRAKQAKAAR